MKKILKTLKVALFVLGSSVSLLIQYCSKSLIEDCGGSSHIPVDRAGGVKIKAFTSLILWSYGNIVSCSCKI